MRAALADPDLFGRVFAGESGAAWRVLLIAAMGEALTQAECIVFEMLTGRPREPGARVDELLAVIGRRGGKTRAVAIWPPLSPRSAIMPIGWRRENARILGSASRRTQ